MHKEWQRLSHTDVQWNGQYRVVSEFNGRGDTLGDTWYEQKVDVPDENDEPQVDGLYVDNVGDRWVRLNGEWNHQDSGLNIWELWGDGIGFAEYGPYKLVDPSDY